jgi:hypothetical protein
MNNTQRTSPDPTTEIMRANWEWSGRYALFWIVVTLFIFGAIFAVLDYGEASESIRIQSFVLLATNFAQRDLASSGRFGCSYRIDVESNDNPLAVSRPEMTALGCAHHQGAVCILLIERDGANSCLLDDAANARAECFLTIPAQLSSELRIPGAAAQTRVVSMSEIRLFRRKSGKISKG